MSDIPEQQQLIAALCDPLHSPLGPGPIRVIETHISWVVLAGRHAYKIKKAVDLEFLDFTTLTARHHYCEEELRINRRIAPKLYLEVVPIGGSLEHPVPGREPAIEYAVKMRRFPPGKLLDKLLHKGQLLPQHIDSLALTLAAFHRGLPPADAETPWGSPDSIHAAATQNFEQIGPLLPDPADREEVAAVRRLADAAFAAHENDFAERRAQGMVRECHGDLHLGNVALVRGKPVPFDAIEFSPDLRWQDVMSETAFLVMDLLHREEDGLAFRFLNAYLQAGGDYAGLGILPFYLSYRAMVRAKISAIRAEQPGLSRLAYNREISDAHQYLTLAQRCLETRRGALIITHGLPGSGKTTFAQSALERLGAIRVRSDVERKRLFGLDPLEDSRAGPDIYSKDATRRTYQRLHDLARIALVAGFPVIVDAAFMRRDEREHFQQLADELHVPFAIASLEAPDGVLQSRLAQRQTAGEDASEADARVLALLQFVAEPLAEPERALCAVFDDAPDIASLADSRGWERLNTLLDLHS